MAKSAKIIHHPDFHLFFDVRISVEMKIIVGLELRRRPLDMLMGKLPGKKLKIPQAANKMMLTQAR